MPSVPVVLKHFLEVAKQLVRSLNRHGGASSNSALVLSIFSNTVFPANKSNEPTSPFNNDPFKKIGSCLEWLGEGCFLAFRQLPHLTAPHARLTTRTWDNEAEARRLLAQKYLNIDGLMSVMWRAAA